LDRYVLAMTVSPRGDRTKKLVIMADACCGADKKDAA
jgi:hypothetical protein